MDERPDSYNIASEIVNDSFVSTAAVVTSSPYVGYYHVFETIIWGWDEEKRTDIKHHIHHSNEKEATKVHGYIVNNMKNAG